MWKIALALIIATSFCSAAYALDRAKIIILFSSNSSASSPPLIPCTNQLVLAYNNSCALIGQAWGQ